MKNKNNINIRNVDNDRPHVLTLNANKNDLHPQGVVNTVLNLLTAATKDNNVVLPQMAPISKYRGRLMQTVSDPSLILVLSVENLVKAETVFSNAMDLVGPWLEAIHTGDVDSFYDDLEEVENLFEDTEEIGKDKNSTNKGNYDQLCAESRDVIEILYKDLLIGYNINCIKDMFYKHKVEQCNRLDSTTVVLTMVPRN